MAKLIIEDDKGNTHVLPDADVTFEWESDPDASDPAARWLARPLFARPSYGKTLVAASTHSPMTTLSLDASESERLEALGFGEDMKLVRQGTPIAPADIRKGDRIRIEWIYDDGTTLTREEIARCDGYVYTSTSTPDQRRIYLLERAPFKLPTTPGAVVRVETDEDVDGAADYVLDLGGVWRGGENGSRFYADTFEEHFDGDPQILVGGES